MLAAVQNGDARELAKLMRQDPCFNVNMRLDGDKFSLLHHACDEDGRSAVIPLLLAHPDINVNRKNKYGSTPFYCACFGYTSSVREMLKDSRVKVNERNSYGYTPLHMAAYGDHFDIIKWWIASGREMDLGKPGDVYKTDAIGGAKEQGKTDVVTLLERFKENPVETRHAVRVDLGLLDELALRCSPWWSLSLMDYSKSKKPTRPPLLQPDSSPLPPGFLWNFKWSCASAR